MQSIQGVSVSLAIAISSLLGASAAHAEKCFPAQEVEIISQNFEQLKPFVGSGNPVCESQTGAQWAKVIESLIDLKNIKLDAEKEFQTKDDFSFQAIQKNQWWEYFTERADTIVLEGSFCRPGVVAYVHPFMTGTVNLCGPYYESDRIGRAETLLHEVRHFEGFGHVTCSRGADKGTAGACDTTLEEKGSYAVSMQASITLGLRGQGFSDGERALGRAQALYLLVNRFNEETDVKIRESLYLETADGSVYDWSPTEGKDPQFVAKLTQPAQIFAASIETILYPMDVNAEAYRMAEDFTSKSPRLGMFADKYNEKSPSERAQYKAISYNTNGGFLTETGFSTLCEEGIQEYAAANFPEPLVTIVTVQKESQNLVDYVVGQSGQAYAANCASGTPTITPQNVFIPREVKKAAIVDGQYVALTTDGQLYGLEKTGNQFQLAQPINFSGGDQNWIEVAIRVMPYLFDEAKSNPVTVGSL